MADKESIRFENLMKDLKNQIYYPVYLLHGEEPYYLDEVSDYIEQHVLNEMEKEFNQTIVYGKDSNVPTLVSYARRFPMMANYQVLILKEAQDLEKIEELQTYIDNPLPSTILVICYKYGKLDKRRTFYKSIEKRGIIFESARIPDYKIPDWITDYLGKRGYTITQKASALLTEFLGTDLSKIANELEKLLINIPAGSQVNEDYVERNIGISKDFNVFELQRALGKKDVLKANRIILYFASNLKENPLVKVIPLLFSFFSKILHYHGLPDKSVNAVASELGIKPFFVTEYQQAAKAFPLSKTVAIIALLREYDLKAKGVDSAQTPDGELMKELIFRILH